VVARTSGAEGDREKEGQKEREEKEGESYSGKETEKTREMGQESRRQIQTQCNVPALNNTEKQ